MRRACVLGAEGAPAGCWEGGTWTPAWVLLAEINSCPQSLMAAIVLRLSFLQVALKHVASCMWCIDWRLAMSSLFQRR